MLPHVRVSARCLHGGRAERAVGQLKTRVEDFSPISIGCAGILAPAIGRRRLRSARTGPNWPAIGSELTLIGRSRRIDASCPNAEAATARTCFAVSLDRKSTRLNSSH